MDLPQPFDFVENVPTNMMQDLDKGAAAITVMSGIMEPENVVFKSVIEPVKDDTYLPVGEGTKGGVESDFVACTSEKDITQTCDDEECDVSILSYDSQSFPIIPITTRGQITCAVALIVVLFSSVTLATVCGLGFCRRYEREASNSIANIGADNSGADDFPRSSNAPSSTPMNLLLRTSIPTVEEKDPMYTSTQPSHYGFQVPLLAFTSTQELYDAVDEYLQTGHADPLYGHPIGVWNTSLLTNLSNVFDADGRNPLAYYFNENLSGWDTSRVWTMENMFLDARSFNGDVSTWKTGRVTNMYQTFGRATSFSGDVSQWDVSSVTTMKRICTLLLHPTQITFLHFCRSISFLDYVGPFHARNCSRSGNKFEFGPTKMECIQCPRHELCIFELFLISRSWIGYMGYW
jgi:surface protein